MSSTSFKSKFGIGDTAWKVAKVARSYEATCDLCAGDGSVKISGSDRTTGCPECYSRGRVWKQEEAHHESQLLTVGQVRITAGRGGTEVQYMCHETGIGSGSLHDEDGFFVSSEEAKAECKKRDAALKLEAQK